MNFMAFARLEQLSVLSARSLAPQALYLSFYGQLHYSITCCVILCLASQRSSPLDVLIINYLARQRPYGLIHSMGLT